MYGNIIYVFRRGAYDKLISWVFEKQTFISILRFKILLIGLYWGTINDLSGQDIALKNPSLEGSSKRGEVPAYWEKAVNTPDTQPGSNGIIVPASHGKTYVGAIHSKVWDEGMGQRLTSEIKKDKTYELSFDLAYSNFYLDYICAGAFAIYGETIIGDKAELLWKSGPFYHTDWKRYNAIFTPSNNYIFLSFYPYSVDECLEREYTSYLVDNFSSAIREVPKIELFTRNTCKGTHTGSALVRVKGGQAPYHYTWSPGGNATPEIANLGAGIYEVIVTGANGAVIKEQVYIEEVEVKAEVVLTPATCYSLNDAAISIIASGGNFPYSYSLNNGSIIQDEPDFKHLKVGTYKVDVTDSRGCSATLDYLNIPQPPPLQITSIYTQPVSCSETQDGKIALNVSGGTAPYSYSLDFHSWQGDSSWNQLDAGRYHFQIKDNNGCKATGATEVTKNWRDCAVLVPTAFSPNGDGLNDVFRARVHDAVRDFKLIVYNRWGQQVFQSNDPAQGWDGGQQTTGSYLWVLMYMDSKNQARKQQGNLMLIK